MDFKDLNDFFIQVRNQNVPTLEQYNYLEEKTNKFESNKLELLLSDLKDFRKAEKGKLLQQYKIAKKTKTYKKIIDKGDSIPYIDFYEGFLAIGREKDLPDDFIAIEGEKYLALFFPKKLSAIDQLISHLEKLQPHDETKSSTPLNLPSNLKWEGDHIEFSEVVKALIEAKKLSGTSEKAIFEDLCAILNLNDFNKTNRLKGLKKRVHDTTPFLYKLVEGLNAWIDQNGKI